jgi:uncharacterized membrane protein
MTQTEQSTAKTPSRGLRIALAVSVALNLGILGMLAGAYFNHGDSGGRGGDFRDIGFGPFTEALSREDRDALRKAFIAKMPDIREARRAMRQNQQDLLAALRAEPFDQSQLETVLAAQSDRAGAQLATGQALLKDLLIQMSPEARLGFADRLEERLSHGRDKPKAKN